MPSIELAELSGGQPLLDADADAEEQLSLQTSGVGAKPTGTASSPLDSNSSGKILYQHGFSRHWLGTLLHCSWVFVILFLNALMLLCTVSFYFNGPALRWYTMIFFK